MMYEEGLGASKDKFECRRLLEIAVSRGHLFAKRDLAGLYARGAFGMRRMPFGVLMLFSLSLDMTKITIRGEFKINGFEDRTLA